MNMISNTADAHEFGTEVAADSGYISMNARPHVRYEPRFAILGAKDDVNDHFTKRLGHGANDDRTDAGRK